MMLAVIVSMPPTVLLSLVLITLALLQVWKAGLRSYRVICLSNVVLLSRMAIVAGRFRVILPVNEGLATMVSGAVGGRILVVILRRKCLSGGLKFPAVYVMLVWVGGWVVIPVTILVKVRSGAMMRARLRWLLSVMLRLVAIDRFLGNGTLGRHCVPLFVVVTVLTLLGRRFYSVIVRLPCVSSTVSVAFYDLVLSIVTWMVMGFLFGGCWLGAWSGCPVSSGVSCY